MPDNFDSSGLQIKSLTELKSELETAFRDIYGQDINLDPNSPDGQIIAIFAQAGIDLRELLQKINSGFDPDQAEGVVLDQRVAINGISRKGGTYTTVEVDVTVDRALNLVGLDSESAILNPDIANLYTVRDDAGTEFYLLNSQSPGAAGIYTYEFRAADIGAVEVQVNTITTPVTVKNGVTGINNPSGVLVQGEDEESDADLRARRQQSTAITAIGNIDGLEAAINNLDGVTTVIVRENFTNSTDSDGTPAHTIWCIVDGGDDTEIAQVIKSRKTHGAGMRGAESVNIPYNDGRPYIVQFDRPVSESLYIRFSLLLPGGVVDTAEIKRKIVNNINWQVGEDATASTITAFVQSINPDYVITAMEVSDDDATWLEVVSPGSIQNRFVNDVSRITIT